MSALELKIRNTLMDIGMTPNLSGYYYSVYAILKIVDNPDIYQKRGGTGRIYQEVADFYMITPSAAERSIRFSKLKMLDAKSEFPLALRMFGNKTKVTQGEFLTTIAEFIRLDRC